MNNKIDDLMYQAGLTAQGCWDELDEYNRTAILKFAELIVKECAQVCNERAINSPMGSDEQCEADDCASSIMKQFGINE